MAERIKEDTDWYYGDLEDYNTNEIIEYFTKKAREV